jgi:hypothetical protein
VTAVIVATFGVLAAVLIAAFAHTIVRVGNRKPWPPPPADPAAAIDALLTNREGICAWPPCDQEENHQCTAHSTPRGRHHADAPTDVISLTEWKERLR